MMALELRKANGGASVVIMYPLPMPSSSVV